MSPGVRLALLAGCVVVAALVCPSMARVAGEDLLGPYAPKGSYASGTALANAASAVNPVDEEEMHGDAHGDADPEAAHDAP